MSESGTPHVKWYAVIAAPFVLFGGIIAAMNFVSPLSAGPAGILFIFTLIYLWCLSVLFGLLYAGSRLLQRSRWGGVKAFEARKAYYAASVLACFPVLLLAIGSIGQIDFISVGLATLFVGLATFYTMRRT